MAAVPILAVATRADGGDDMTEDRIMQQEQPWKPAWLEWIIYPSCLAIAHFYLLFVLSLALAYRMP